MTVELGSLSPTALLVRLEKIGIVPRIELDDDFIARSRVLPMRHQTTGMGVDVVLAGPGPEETFLDRARRTRFGDVDVRIASPTDIIVMKILAGRPKDVDDVIGILLAAPAGLDVAEARAVLGELGELLDQSDLVPTLDAALETAGRR